MTAHCGKLPPGLTSADITVFVHWRHMVSAAAWIGIVLAAISVIDVWPSRDVWKSVIERENIFPAVMLTALFIVFTFIRGIRWGLLLKRHIVVRWRLVLPLFAWCFMLGVLIPYRAGELARPLWVKRLGGSIKLGIGTLIVERLHDLLVVAALFAAALSFAPVLPRWVNGSGLLILSGLVVAYIVFMALIPMLSRRLNERTHEHAVMRLFTEFVSVLASFGGWRVCLEQLILSAGIWGAIVVAFKIYLAGMLPGLDWVTAVMVVVAMVFSGLFQVTPGNLGIFEATLILVLVAFGFPEDRALVAAVSLHAVHLTAMIGTGVVGRAWAEWSMRR